MKSIPALALAVVLAATSWSALADDAHHPEASAPKKVAAKVDEPTAKMDAQMKAMRQMHEKMMNAKTPEERKALMGEHMKTMRDSMSMMNGAPMMNGMMDQRGADGKPMSPQAMQKQMDMMKMMMQMMMDRMDAMTPPPAK